MQDLNPKAITENEHQMFNLSEEHLKRKSAHLKEIQEKHVALQKTIETTNSVLVILDNLIGDALAQLNLSIAGANHWIAQISI